VSVLSAFPTDFDAAIAVVQHLPIGFVQAFAEFLQSRIALKVKIVDRLQALEKGHVYLAGDDLHLIALNEKHFAPSGSPPVEGHRPAATVLFESLAARLGPRSCGVILSGMGKDGVTGLGKMRASGALTLAQEEAGCAVFGMPRAALEANAASAALDPVSIAREVTTWVSLQPEPRKRQP
jgi:chemotaxis response regulator CheB